MRVRLKNLIAPCFWEVHRAIRRGEVQEVVAKGGRGSGKSSYISLELVVQLLRHPDCHAIVLRKVGGTMRTSVYAQVRWAIGALGLYISDESVENFQPMNINFSIIAPLEQRIRKKAEKNLAISQRALMVVDALKETGI